MQCPNNFNFLKAVNSAKMKYNNKLTNILADMIHYNRVTKNINIEPDSNINLKSIFCSINKIIDPNQEKFVLRQSMWDPVIRVYYDYREKNNFDTILNKINNEFIKL